MDGWIAGPTKTFAIADCSVPSVAAARSVKKTQDNF
jgi:hypothetical protein